jgi:hypothetical protein
VITRASGEYDPLYSDDYVDDFSESDQYDI